MGGTRRRSTRDRRRQGGRLDAIQQMMVMTVGPGRGVLSAVLLLPEHVSLRRRRQPGRRGRAPERRHDDVRLERPLQPLERPDRRLLPGAGVFRHRPVAGAALPQRTLGRARAGSASSSTAWPRSRCSSSSCSSASMVFVFYIYQQPPLSFQPIDQRAARRAGDARRASRRIEQQLRPGVRRTPGAPPIGC